MPDSLGFCEDQMRIVFEETSHIDLSIEEGIQRTRSLSLHQSFCLSAKALSQKEFYLPLPDVLGRDIKYHLLTSTQES
jgi:hypothetical protein